MNLRRSPTHRPVTKLVEFAKVVGRYTNSGIGIPRGIRCDNEAMAEKCRRFISVIEISDPAPRDLSRDLAALGLEEWAEEAAPTAASVWRRRVVCRRIAVAR